jgi:ABC-type Na+ transport system ATPase subunit NatA
MADVEALCDRALVLSHGRVMLDAAAPAAVAAYTAGIA